MPVELERKLQAEAERKFPGDKKRQDAYVYGTLRSTGWVPSTQKASVQVRAHTRGRKRKEAV